MDGVEGKLNNSLQKQLSVRLSAAIVIIAICGGAFSFKAAFEEAYEFQDDQLRQIAGLMEQQSLMKGEVIVQTKEKSADSESQVVVQVFGNEPSEIHSMHREHFRLPADIPEGIQTFQATRFTWRLFVRRLPSGNKLVVGQRTRVRDELARDNALRTLYPLVILIPLLIILVNGLIRRMLKPVTSLAAELDRRSDNDLECLDDSHVPAEVKPFTASINRLLQRVRKSIDIQRRFVADAAHELRSPLTALSLQAENLAKTPLPEAAEERLAALRGGLHRSRQLLEQLLAMARSQTTTTLPDAQVPMQYLFQRTLEDLMPLAQARDLDIEVSVDETAVFYGQEIDGVTLLKNLIDNAIRYTPVGGRIRLRARQHEGRLMMEVEDNGPGIALAERERVFDPFYRVIGAETNGSGLGLAIVKTIVERMHAEIRLANLDDQQGGATGLRVTVTFPAPALA
jgi:two-component system OmpR family sensor kinase